MTGEQLRLEALRLSVSYCGRRDLGSTEVIWYADQFVKFLKGEANE